MQKYIDTELRLSLSATEAYVPAVAADMGNPAWEAATGRILILRLSSFRDIEGSTAHLVLFSECRKSLPEAYIDFAFFPDKRDRAVLSTHEAPYFFGIESGRNPASFDLILVSNAFSLELVNLGYLYAGSGLPRRASQRRALDAALACPIVMLGGSNAASAGALLFPGPEAEEGSDCLVDGIFFGEGEGAGLAPSAIGELAVALTSPGRSRVERLELAAAVEGLWLALSGRKAVRKTLRPFPRQTLGYPVLNSPGAAAAKLQITAGCPGFCSFCLEGWESRPYREIPVAEIAAAARELKASTGASCLEVYSYNFNTHAGIFELIFELSRIFRRVNFMSQRLDILAESPALASAELAADKRSFTLGIEGISDRLRRYYRKGIGEAQIDEALRRLTLPAVREIKLFYILAGIEDDRDVAEFAAFAARAAEARRRAAPGLRLIVSAGYLARLPFTPLQYAPLCLDRDKLETIAQRIEGACAAAGIEYRLAADFEEYYADQLLALGGRGLAPWLEAAPEADIAHDGSLSRGAAESLEAFASRADEGGKRLLDPAFFAEKGEAWRPPLSFIDDNGEALRKNYILAAGFAAKEGRLEAAAAPGLEWERRLERLMIAKRDFASVIVRVELPRSMAGAREEYRSAWILRRIAGTSPDRGASVFDAEEALFSRKGLLEGALEPSWGLAFYRLRGPDAGRMAAAARAAGLAILEALPSTDRVAMRLEAPAAFAREVESAFRHWLAAESVEVIERREGSGRRLSCSPRDAKKKLLHEALVIGPEHSASGSLELRISLGIKARVAPWLSRLEAPARRALSLRIEGVGEA